MSAGAAILEDRFEIALERLDNWHYDSVKAQAYDGPAVSSSKPGAKIFLGQAYPARRHWRDAFGAYRRYGDVEGMERCCDALEDEYRALSRRPHRLERYRDTWGKTRYRKVHHDT